MARDKAPKSQFNMRIPAAVVEHLDERYRRTGVEKQLQALAGLVAFEWCGEALRTAMIQWATRVATGEVSWPEVVEALRGRKGPSREQKDLLDLLQTTSQAPGHGGTTARARRQA